jgi:uncharacterized protein
MELSKHNVTGQVKNSDNCFIINPLYGEADLIEKQTRNALENGNWEKVLSEELKAELTEKHYIVDPEAEQKAWNKAYLDFLDDRDDDEKQIFFVPWYSCNFNCTYCYQSGYDPVSTPLTKETIDAFFTYIKSIFSGEKYYITLFGGEPLLPGTAHKEMISYFIEKAGDTALAIVTNGYSLEQYLPLFKAAGANIREIQLTLDGMAEMHNKRRPLHSGEGGFEQISANIGRCLEQGYQVNLRVVTDKENIAELPAMAAYAKEQGWTSSALFKTQLGRNYELHYYQTKQSKLYERLEMWAAVYDLIKEHPVILEFHKPAFSISRFLFENGELPVPLFDSCPACKTEWAFDYTGRIYSCTATVGKEDEVLGSFYPQVYEDEDKIANWKNRDVVEIEACHSCASRLLCGGGCGAVAKNKTGSVNSPDCRPVKGLIELGIGLYSDNN